MTITRTPPGTRWIPEAGWSCDPDAIIRIGKRHRPGRHVVAIKGTDVGLKVEGAYLRWVAIAWLAFERSEI
jgi:hypothetical protein